MAYRKTLATEARKLARRRILLDAACALFGRHGYHATTVPMIVAEADSSVGSFYAHFRNKEDVFAAVLEELGARVAKAMHQAELSRSDPKEGLPSAVESLFLFLAENPAVARILIVESSGLSPRLEQVRRSLLRHHVDSVCHKLEARPDVFLVMSPPVAARCLVGAVFEALSGWLEQSSEIRPSAIEVARAVVDYNCRAVLR